MNVVWVNRFGPQLASYRYRAQVPADEMAKLGHSTAINNGEADIVVYSKPYGDDLEAAKKAKAEGAKIVVDFAGDHFAGDPLYGEFAALADAIVVPTQTMRARVYDYTKRDSAVITDPYETPECVPHAEGDQYMWFGHIGNFSELKRVLPLMGDRKLRVVSGPQPIPSVIQWSVPNLHATFEASNIVILPTLPGNEFKSPNRLVNSIRAGCFPVCMEHPAYMEFQPLIWVGDFKTGIKWSEAFRSDLNERVLEAQAYVRDRFSPETIGKQWASFLESV